MQYCALCFVAKHVGKGPRGFNLFDVNNVQRKTSLNIGKNPVFIYSRLINEISYLLPIICLFFCLKLKDGALIYMYLECPRGRVAVSRDK